MWLQAAHSCEPPVPFTAAIINVRSRLIQRAAGATVIVVMQRYSSSNWTKTGVGKGMEAWSLLVSLPVPIAHLGVGDILIVGVYHTLHPCNQHGNRRNVLP